MAPLKLVNGDAELRATHRLVISPVDGYVECTLCDRRFWSMEYTGEHLASERHKSKLKMVEWEELVADPSKGVMGNEALGIPCEIECRGDTWFNCSICSCLLYSADQVLGHCAGRRHKDNLRKSPQQSLPAVSVFSTPSTSPKSMSQPYIPRNRLGKRIPPPPTRMPVLTDLPAGLRYCGKNEQIGCEICEGKVVGGLLDALNHCVSDLNHLHAIRAKINSLIAHLQPTSRLDIHCELCNATILGPAHFESASHLTAIELLRRLGSDYFQPFREVANGEINFFSWTHARVLTKEHLLWNNPQLLLNQWMNVRGELPTGDWPISLTSFAELEGMLSAIPPSQVRH